MRYKRSTRPVRTWRTARTSRSDASGASTLVSVEMRRKDWQSPPNSAGLFCSPATAINRTQACNLYGSDSDDMRSNGIVDNSNPIQRHTLQIKKGSRSSPTVHASEAVDRIAAKPSRGFHALLKGRETAICPAARCSLAVNRAPRIVLGLGMRSSADHTDANPKQE
jgi:hypothetical protein